MALRNSISRLVDSVFDRYLQDLAVDVQLNQSDATDYNFETGEARVVNRGRSIVKGVLTTEAESQGYGTSNAPDSNRNDSILLIRAKDIDTPSVYDSFIIDGNTWKVEDFSTDGYVVTFRISGR